MFRLQVFDFSSIGTLDIWLDARDASSIRFSGFPDNTVDRWNNQVTSKPVSYVEQISFASQPSLVSGAVNGHNALRFDGTDVMTWSAAMPSTPVYIYVLAQRTGSYAGDMGIVGIEDAGVTMGHWNLNLNIGNFVVFNVSNIAITDTFAMDTLGAHIAWGRQTSSSSQDAGLDGSTTNLATTPILPTANYIRVGDTHTSGSGFIGDIVTVLVYSALTPMEHTTVIGELAMIGGVP
jgi:hypothetical protein